MGGDGGLGWRAHAAQPLGEVRMCTGKQLAVREEERGAVRRGNAPQRLCAHVRGGSLSLCRGSKPEAVADA